MKISKKNEGTKNRHMRRSALKICLLFSAFVLSGCAAKNETVNNEGRLSAPAISTGTVGIEADGEYGNVLIGLGADEFNALGFHYGDSVDVIFSNGYTLSDIPYFTGYYTMAGDPLLLNFGGDLVAAINYGSLWIEAELSDADTVEITLHQAGKYLDIENALNIEYTDERSDYASDEVFANFRSIETHGLKKDTLFRSASPCDNKHNRAPYTDALMENAGVKLVIDLADSDEEIEGFISSDDFDSPCFASLYAADAVVPVNLQVDYTSDDYKKNLADALRKIAENDGPYLIHCLEGKDRTGFVCILLEALTGADYDEMAEDYMMSYDNYYGINPQSDPEKYNTILNNNYVPMITFLCGADNNTDPSSLDFKAGAENYLLSGGMTSEEIDALRDALQR